MIVGDVPDDVLYLRRYVYYHYSTGKPHPKPWVCWQVVKNSRPGDYEFKMVGKVT